MDAGVVTLPVEFFCQGGVSVGRAMGSCGVAFWDNWIRFSVANVDDEKVGKVSARLVDCDTSFGWEVKYENRIWMQTNEKKAVPLYRL